MGQRGLIHPFPRLCSGSISHDCGAMSHPDPGAETVRVYVCLTRVTWV